ncbi:hypothetical protein JCGZ_01913 [Jatropha curcas]|uniref:Uncharacterized protein n=1 Tax=Jatropha curcas TaxID=180498 RepID=A0A067LCA7_JATCU|nr:GDSL esterase/lipase At3g48460 [Jatropha curcas]KDP42125.1 hypothetical protein JCGZ_01913 [Jatropha curcas]
MKKFECLFFCISLFIAFSFSFAHEPPAQDTPQAPPRTETPPPAQEKETPPPAPEKEKPPPAPEKEKPPPTQEKETPSGETTINTNVEITFKGSFTKVYAFGDSYTDTGNCFFVEGLKAFLLKVSSQYAKLTNLHGHRLCNGRLVIDFLCHDIGLPPLEAYKDVKANFSGGANFAVGGSTCLSSQFFANQKIFRSLMWKPVPDNTLEQIEWFNSYLQSAGCKEKDDAKCKTQIENSLFWIGALGSSDYARILGSSFSGKSLSEASVGHVGQFLQSLLDKGAKYIIVQGLPPVGCCPLQMLLNKAKGHDELGCSAAVNSMIMSHNELLQKSLEEYREGNKDCVIIFADTWKAYMEILKDHKKFNFEEPFKACCGVGGGELNFCLKNLCGSAGSTTCKDPEKYISWDGIHFTEAMNKHLAKLLFHEKGYCSPEFDVLIEARKKVSVSVGASTSGGAA